MTKILITGGAGYIGSHAVKKLLEEGDDVVVADNFSHGFKQALENLASLGNLTVVETDLRNKNEIDEIFKNHKIDAVMHFAALISVSESVEDPYNYFKTNVFGALNLLESMREAGVDKLIISSTCAVYGQTQYLPVDEKHPMDPTSPYGKSKQLMETLVKEYSNLFGMRYVSLRYFNVAGADPDSLLGYSTKPSIHLIPNAVQGAMGLKKFQLTCGKVDTQDGTPVRDYVNINDLIDAHVLALKYLLEGGESDVFNIGTGKGSSVLEIVETIERVTGAKIERVQAEPRDGEYAEIYAVSDKAKTVLGWEPRRTLEDTIISLKNWFEKYPKGFDY